MSRDNLGGNLVFFLIGAAAGAAIALLYAPQDGESTRRLISEKAGDVKEKATELSANAAASAKDRWTATTDKIQGLIQRGQISENLATTQVGTSNGNS